MNLLSFDLNLLRVFDAIYIERSVSRAAVRLSLSQPAVSNALSRLREAFDDPLFERTAEGMVPTPRAKAIAEPIQRSLDLLRAGLRKRGEFDYRQSSRTFELAVEDYGESAIFPRFFKWLNDVAPDIRVTIQAKPNSQVHSDLRRGKIDLALVYFAPIAPEFRSRRIMTDTLRTVARKNHPDVPDRLNLDTFLKLKHVALIPRSKNTPIVDLTLARQGLERHIAVQVPHFQSMPLIVQTTDMLGTMPKRMAHLYADNFGLQVHQPPLDLPAFPLYLIWHQSADNDVAHTWLRNALTDLCQRL